MPKPIVMTTEEFIDEAIEVHGDKYDYSETVYKKWSEPVKIICPMHEEFYQTPRDHLRDPPRGCRGCSSEKNGEKCRLTQEEFLRKAHEKHGNRYDYSKAIYVKNSKKIIIICKIH